MGEFTFKPSTLHDVETWALHSGVLRNNDGVEIDLSTVNRGDFTDVAQGQGAHTNAVKLWFGENAHELKFMGAEASESRWTFLALCSALFEELAFAAPNARFTINGDSSMTWMAFIFGLGMLLGAPFAAFAGMGAQETDRFHVLLFLSALLAVLGVVVAYRFWPWRAPDIKTATQMTQELARVGR